MLYPKIPLAQTIVLLFKAKNIQHIVISPGSRNAPATIGFTQDDFFTCYSIVDERCAAFFALGIAQQINKPVAVLCSSGSALLNYYPAVSEAYFSQIPLIVLSADRPKHLIGIGDGQTINQRDVYKNHVVYTANLSSQMDAEFKNREEGEPAIIKSLENKLERFLGRKQELQQENETEINKALNKAISKRGPVHINMPFHEPLYEVTDTLVVDPKVIDIEKRASKVDDFIYNECLDMWNSSAKKMVLVGVNPPNAIEQKWLDELVKDNSVIVFTETTSNIHNPRFFNSIDTMIAPLDADGFKLLQPDILLTFGGLIVSKKIKACLRTHQPKEHWHIDRDYANDTFFCLEKHIETSPNNFFETFLPQITHFVKSDYKATWQEIRDHRLQKHEAYLNEIPFSDFQAFDVLFKSLPQKIALQLGNSSTIRYAQLFNIHKSIDVFCNRGTSGIDGSTSTAIGCAVVQSKQTVFITGDLSFFYDSNALWNNYIPANFRIIIINNQGGGIFRILPGNKNSEIFENFFETTHNYTAKELAKMYGFQYTTANNTLQLKNKLKDFYKESETPKILEVFTPRKSNDEILLDYFKFVK